MKLFKAKWTSILPFPLTETMSPDFSTNPPFVTSLQLTFTNPELEQTEGKKLKKNSHIWKLRREFPHSMRSPSFVLEVLNPALATASTLREDSTVFKTSTLTPKFGHFVFTY